MIYIAHRGNCCGKNYLQENTYDYINSALQKGFYVEVDVWLINKQYYLGHDRPDVECGIDFLQNKNIICHAKNIDCATSLANNKDVHWFYHETDQITLTSNGWIWCYPRVFISNSVCNQLEFNSNMNKQEIVDEYLSQIAKYNFLAICSDYVSDIRDAMHV